MNPLRTGSEKLVLDLDPGGLGHQPLQLPPSDPPALVQLGPVADATPPCAGVI